MAAGLMVGCGDSKAESKGEALEPAAQGSVSDTDMAKIATLRINPWTLVSLNNNGTEIDIPVDVKAVIEFKDKEFSGKTGCNSIFGSYEMNADSISFGEGAGMTRMMCPPEVMAVEDTLVKVLNGSTSFDFSGDALILEKDGIAARFSH